MLPGTLNSVSLASACKAACIHACVDACKYVHACVEGGSPRERIKAEGISVFDVVHWKVLNSIFSRCLRRNQRRRDRLGIRAQGLRAPEGCAVDDPPGHRSRRHRLDCFDTVLPNLYADAGFVPVARLAWNDDYSPDGWDYQLFDTFNGGRPDVVFMAYDPGRVGGIYNPGTADYVDDYDVGVARAQAYRPGMSKT